MDLEQSIKDFNEMMNTIQTKYDSIMKEVQKQQEKIDNIYNDYNDRSEEFIQNEIKKRQAKIDKWTAEAEKMLKEQTDNAQTWFDSKKEEIETQIQRTIKKILEYIL